MDMGIKRGRRKVAKELRKQQWNVRLAPEYSTLLEDPSPIKAWMRKNQIRIPNTERHGSKSLGTISASDIIAVMIHQTMKRIMDDDEEWLLDYYERNTLHAKWARMLLL